MLGCFSKEFRGSQTSPALEAPQVELLATLLTLKCTVINSAAGSEFWTCMHVSRTTSFATFPSRWNRNAKMPGKPLPSSASSHPDSARHRSNALGSSPVSGTRYINVKLNSIINHSRSEVASNSVWPGRQPSRATSVNPIDDDRDSNRRSRRPAIIRNLLQCVM